jgi:SAM-dependent methyltransferase
MDAALPMTQAARQRAAREGAEIALAVATAEAMPYASERFDCAVAVTMLCFAADAEEAVHEMARVLRPGGRLVIGELGRWSLWAGSRRLRGWLGHPVWRRARFRTADELRDLVIRAGLRVEDLRGAIFYPPCGAAARLSSGIDRPLGRLTTVGAAFLALLAVKPAAR